MSRWHQFSIDSWMAYFCPGNNTTSEALTPLPDGVADGLKAITQEVLSKYFPKEEDGFDTVGKEAKMSAPIVRHRIFTSTGF